MYQKEVLFLNILFIHPSYPGQFLYLAYDLAQNPDNKVYFLSEDNGIGGAQLKNVKLGLYAKTKDDEAKAAKEAGSAMESTILAHLEGRNVLRALDYLTKKEKFMPDIVIGHTGWGSMMYIKDFYKGYNKDMPVLGYFEWYYRSENSDAFWWPDEQAGIGSRVANRNKNINLWLSYEGCDQGLVPTKWQYSKFPKEFQSKLNIIHEGIDTDFCSPLPERPGLELHTEEIDLKLPKGTEILTYLSRGFEAYRGFPQFMDAMRIVLEKRPQCHVVIAGSDRVVYGKQLKEKSYKIIEEEKGGYDKDRVHFTGTLNRGDYQKMLRSSSCHVYLTRPFILSWSMMEAMSFALPMVCSMTPPCEEIMINEQNGLLADFRSPHHIAEKIIELLDNREKAHRLGKAARETIIKDYRLQDCLRKQKNLIYSMVR